MSASPDKHHPTTGTHLTMEDTTDSKKLTLGEELWQVHVNRAAHSETGVSADDVDHEVGAVTSKNKAATDGQPHRSVGEELWEIHCKRSRGNLDEDYPEEEKEQNHDVDDAKHQKLSGDKDRPHGTPSSDVSSKVIHLRNRDVTVSP